MFSNVRQMMTAGLIVAGLSVSPAMAQTIGEPDVPADLVVPAGHVLFAKGSAVGTQNYMCLPKADGSAEWKGFAPEATLFVPVLGLHPQLATHFFVFLS